MKKQTEKPVKPTVKEVRHWKRPDLIDIKKKPGFGYKFSSPDDLQRHLSEGWEIDKSGAIVRPESSSMEKGVSHYRSLILIRMPIHMCKERNEYYLNIHKARLRAATAGMAMSARAKAESNAFGKPGHVSTIGRVAIKTYSDSHGLHHTNTETINPGEVSEKDIAELNAAKES